MRILALLVTVLASTACGPKHYKVSPEFKIHVSRFERVIGVEVKDIDILFEDLSKEVGQVGYCGNNGVRIDPTYWRIYSYAAQEEVIFHELGHCILNLAHNNNKKDGYPTSIMYHLAFGDSPYYVIHSMEYYAELKQEFEQHRN